MQLFIWIMIVLLAKTSTKEITICNCTEAGNLGILNFKDQAECRVATEPEAKIQVNYTIFTSEEPQLQFKGYMCTAWTKRITTDFYFFGGHDTVKATLPRNLYESDCWRLHKTLDCYGNQMHRIGSQWKFEDEPEPIAQWMTTQISDVDNCMVEEIKLVQDCKGCPIQSPIGTLGTNSHVGYATHNHIMVVWDNNQAKHKKGCEVVEIDSGIGYHSNTSKTGITKIFDVERQIEYVATKPDVPPCNEEGLLQLTMAKKFFIKTQLMNQQVSTNEPTATSKKPTIGSMLAESMRSTSAVIELDKAGHLQFVREVIRERGNALAAEIEALECQLVQHKHLLTLSAAQYDGCLAATHMGLPVCQKIAAVGQIAKVKQCKAQTINITMENTPCGPQPRWNNWTIAATGWELTPSTNCYWRDNLVNINGKPHEYRDGTWQELTGKITLGTLKLVHAFKENIDNSYLYHTKILNPNYGPDPDHINVMADILSVMHEDKGHNRWDNNHPQIHKLLVRGQDRESVSYFSTYIDYAKYIGLSVTLAGGFWVTCVYCGGASCLGSICMAMLCSRRRRSNRRRRSPNADQEDIQEE